MQRFNFRFGEIAGEKAVMEELSLDTPKAPLSMDVVVNGDEVSYQVAYTSTVLGSMTPTICSIDKPISSKWFAILLAFS